MEELAPEDVLQCREAYKLYQLCIAPRELPLIVGMVEASSLLWPQALAPTRIRLSVCAYPVLPVRKEQAGPGRVWQLARRVCSIFVAD